VSRLEISGRNPSRSPFCAVRPLGVLTGWKKRLRVDHLPRPLPFELLVSGGHGVGWGREGLEARNEGCWLPASSWSGTHSDPTLRKSSPPSKRKQVDYTPTGNRPPVSGFFSRRRERGRGSGRHPPPHLPTHPQWGTSEKRSCVLRYSGGEGRAGLGVGQLGLAVRLLEL